MNRETALVKGLWRALAGLVGLMVLPSLGQAANPNDAIATPAFLAHASAVNKFQLAASQLAIRKTQSAVVHGFAHQIVLDYSVAGMSLRQAAADAKLPLHDGLDAAHKALLDTLTHTPPGKTLSKAYFDIEEQTLRDDLAVFEAYARNGDNERLKVFAQETVPVMRSQLEQLGKLHR
jgi:putative membrane protein